MLSQLVALLLIQSDRIASPAPAPAPGIENLAIRVTSPQGVLWQGNVRVSPNQGASYSQSFSQASPVTCPPNSPYDRTERSSINFNIYANDNGAQGFIYRLDTSWQRPSADAGCGERGTRTVSVTKAMALEPGETGIAEGDAGLRVEVTRSR